MAKERDAKIRLSAETGPLQKGLEATQKTYEKFAKTAKESLESLTKNSKAFEQLAKSSKGLRDAFAADIKQFRDYRKAADEIAKANKVVGDGLGGLTKQAEGSNRAFKQLSLDLGENAKGFKAYGQAAEGAQSQFKKLADTVDGAKFDAGAKQLNLFSDATEKLSKTAQEGAEQTGKAFDAIADGSKKLDDVTAGAAKAEGGLKKLFGSAGQGLKAFGWVADVAQRVAILTTAVNGLASAGSSFVGAFTGGGFDRIPEALALINANGISTGSIEQLGLLKDALLGNQAAVQQFSISAVSSFNEFNAALTQVNTIFRAETPEALEQLGQDMQDLANGPLKNLVTSTEALGGQYQVLSGGFTDAAESQQVLNAGLKLSVVGYNDTGSTLSLLVKTMRAYGFESNRALQTAAELNTIVEKGITTIPELSAGFGATATTAAQAGLGIQELGAAVAALTTKGTSTPEALTGVEALLRQIISKTPQAEAALAKLSKETGRSFRFDTQELKDRGLVSLLQELQTATKGNAATLREILPDSLAFSTALGLMAENGEAFADSANALNSSTTENFQDIFETVAADNTKRFEAAVNKSQELLIEFGKSLTPVFEGGLKTIEQLIEFINKIPDPIKNLIAQSLIATIAVRKFTDGLGALGGTFIKVTQQVIAFRAVNLLLQGELLNEIKIIKFRVAAQNDLAGAFKQAVGLNRDRAASLAEAIEWEKKDAKNQENILQVIKNKVFAKNLEKTAIAEGIVAQQAENVATQQGIANKTADVAATNAQSAAESGRIAKFKAKIALLFAEARSQATASTAKVADAAASGAQAKANLGVIATTKLNITTTNLFVGAIAKATLAKLANAKAAFAASGAGAALAVVTGGLSKAFALMTKAALAGAKAMIAFLANPIVLAGVVALGAAMLVFREVTSGATGQVREANKSLREIVDTAANAENQFTKTAESFKTLQDEFTKDGRRKEELGKAELERVEKQEKEREELVKKGLEKGQTFAQAEFQADQAQRSVGQNLLDRINPIARAKQVGALATDTTGRLAAIPEGGRLERQRRLEDREQAVRDTILGVETNSSGVRGRSRTGFDQNGEVLGGVLPAIDRLDKGLGLTGETAQKAKEGFALTATDLKREKDAYEEIREPLEAYISQKEEELEKTKDPARRAAIAADIQELNKQADAYKESYEQGLLYLQVQGEINKRLAINATAGGAGGDFRDAFAAQYESARELLDETLKAAEDGTLDDINKLENAAARYAEQVAVGFEQGLEGFETPEQAGNLLRELRDRTITREVDGQTTTGSALTPADRQQLTVQIAEFEEQASAARIKVIENENAVLEKEASLRIRNSADVEETITANSLKASNDRLSTLDAQIAAFKEYGLSTVELEKQAAQQREQIRLQELENSFQALERDSQRRIELIEQANTKLERQSSLGLGDGLSNQQGIRENNLAIARDQLSVTEGQIAAARAAGESTVELEKEASKQREAIRFQEIENTFAAYESDNKRRLELLDKETRETQLALAKKTISQEEANQQSADVSIRESQSALQVVQDRIEAARAAGEETVDLEKEAARLVTEIQLKQVNETERRFQRQLELRKIALDNEVGAVRLALQAETDLRIQAQEAAIALDQKLFDSRNSVVNAQSELEINRLGNAQQRTADQVEQARIGVQIAEARGQQQARQFEIEQQQLETQFKMNKLGLEREVITNRIAQLENKVAQQKLAIELSEARRNKVSQEEITSLEQQGSLLEQQGEALGQQGDQLQASVKAQDELNSNALAELSIRGQMTAENGAIAVQEAKIQQMTAEMEKQQKIMAVQVQLFEAQAAKLTTALDAQQQFVSLEQQLLKLRQDTFQSGQNFIEGQFDILLATTKDAKERRKLEKEIGQTRLSMLRDSQKLEKLNLEINIQQMELALERKKIENDIARVKADADVKQAQAEVERQKALRDAGKATDLDVEAAQAGLDGAIAQGVGVRISGSFLGREEQLLEAQSSQQRQALDRTQSLQSDQALLEYSQGLPRGDRERRRIERQFRNRGNRNARLGNARGVLADSRESSEGLAGLLGERPDFEAMYEQYSRELGGSSFAGGPSRPASMEQEFAAEAGRRRGGDLSVTGGAAGAPAGPSSLESLQVIALNSGLLVDIMKSVQGILAGDPAAVADAKSSSAEPAQINIQITQNLGEGGTAGMADDAKRQMIEMLRRDRQEIEQAGRGG